MSSCQRQLLTIMTPLGLQREKLPNIVDDCGIGTKKRGLLGRKDVG